MTELEPAPSPWLTIDQAADRLQVSVRTVERLVERGQLAEHRVGRQRRYHVDAVDSAAVPAENDQQD